jgi:anti-anti-sigma regulatory factor
MAVSIRICLPTSALDTYGKIDIDRKRRAIGASANKPPDQATRSNMAREQHDVNTASAQDQMPTLLPQLLDIVQAQSLRDELVRLLGMGSLTLDASAVDRMSTPSAQVLLAAGRAAVAAGLGFQIIKASDVFRTALADLGLQAEFKNWMT